MPCRLMMPCAQPWDLPAAAAISRTDMPERDARAMTLSRLVRAWVASLARSSAMRVASRMALA